MSIVYGIHAILGILKNNPNRIKKIFFDRNRKDNKLQIILGKAQTAGIAVECIDKKELEKKVGVAVHQGVVAECEVRQNLHEADLENIIKNIKKRIFLLVLDGVQDPHNLGACLRSADAAGVNAIIIPKDNSVNITSVVEKVASGAAETIPLVEITNLARTLRNLKEKGIWCYGLSDKATQSIYQADFTSNIALVLGAEDKGIRPNVMSQCDAVYSIPMQGFVSSLNVSVAAGICLFEAVRQNEFMTKK